MAGTVAPNIVTDGLVLYLDAANTKSYVSGSTTWVDMAAGNNGTLVNGPTFSSANGGSIVFDGVDDYGIISNSPSLEITSTITLESWIKSTLLADALHGDGILSKGLSSDNNSGVYETLIASTGGVNYPFFRMRIGSTTPFYWPTSMPLNLNQIYHFVSTYNGSTMRIFINGVEIGSGLDKTGNIQSNSQQLAVGTRYIFRGGGGNNSSFNGNIYSNRIYNRALSAAEVLQNYNATKTRFGL